MQPKRIAVLMITAVFLLTACSKKGPKYTQYIPKDASYVVSIDLKSMVTKLEKDSLTVENMMEVLKDTTDPSKYSKALEIWKQFKDAGLDLESKVLVAVPSIDMNSGSVSVEVLAGLKDGKKLEDFIGKMPSPPKVQKEKDFSYAIKDEMIVAWNSDAVMIVAGTKNRRTTYYEPDADGSTQAAPVVPGSDGSQLDKVKKYFSLKKEESIASVKEFGDLMGKEADVAIFTNTAGLAGANATLAIMPKVKDLLEGIYSTSTINFEDGKMVMDGNTYVGKKLAEILNKYTGPEVDMSLIEPYASNNVDGVVAFSFKPELVSAFLKETGFDALIDMGLAQQGVSMADITKAFKGDFAFIFSDFAVSEVEKPDYAGGTYKSKDPSAKMLFAVRIGDKAAFDKVITVATKTGMFTRQGNRLVPADVNPADAQKLILGIENDLFIYCSDEALYKSYVAKTAKIGLSDEAKSAIKGSSIALFFDGEKILKGIPESLFDSTEIHERNILSRSKTTFKTLTFTTENFDGKKIHGTGELTMAPGKNSLPQLVRFLMYAAEEMKQHDAEREARYKELYPEDNSTDAVIDSAQ